MNSPLCPRCQQSDETPLHATYVCPFSVAVLERAEFFSKLMPGLSETCSSYFEKALEVLTMEEMFILVSILWGNWKERNAVLHGESYRPAALLFDQCYSIGCEINTAYRRNESNGSCPGVGGRVGMNGHHWKAHAMGRLKINCDAAVLGRGAQVGVGWVV